MKKVSIIGAGNVGATLAMRIAEAALADVVLIDIAEDISLGKAMDLTDAAPIMRHDCSISATSNYKEIAGSDVVVITAGFPRTPGMTREELVSKNSSIVKAAVGNIKTHCPRAVIIVVTNPLDVMTHLAYRESGFPRNRVLGMAGVLDAARLRALIAAELKVRGRDVETFVLGSHGDTMVPVISHTKVRGRPIDRILTKDKIEALVTRTRNRGAEIVFLLKSGSAYYAPSASVFLMVRAILKNTREVLCCSCLLEGEYGLRNICIGVPAKIGKNGLEKVVEISLSDDEKQSFKNSAEVIKKTLGKI